MPHSTTLDVKSIENPRLSLSICEAAEVSTISGPRLYASTTTWSFEAEAALR